MTDTIDFNQPIDIDWEKFRRDRRNFIPKNMLPKNDRYIQPHYRCGDRQYHESPGHRGWTETWVRYDDDGNAMFETHRGIDHIWNPKFWEEVEMMTGKDATVRELRDKMLSLSREQCREGFRHYYDLWTWEDSSERNRRLMVAFEQELAVEFRLEDKMMEKSILRNNLWDSDQFNIIKLAAA